jgi:asparagine synthase (glutamine-hydrolysing)
MCGICGVLDLNGSRLTAPELDAMSRVLRHRGPDDHGLFFMRPISLGFRRLSIVDLQGGHQPMSNEDRSVWIVFNGEIYNHSELRPLLQQRGHRYKTQADTETVLHLYEEYGDDCVHHLRGMFAFAIWDARRQRLFCARDRLGIKPFYYAMVGTRFVFASEIKAVLEVEDLVPALNRCALPEYFAFGYLSSDETLFAGVRKLMPGHRLVIDLQTGDKRPQIQQYWDLDITPLADLPNESECVKQFTERFRETVSAHLMSDVPVGVFLSGGLDSSAIAQEMASLREDPIETFSVGYTDDQYSELPYARQVAQHLGARYHEVVLSPEDFFASLPDLIWHEDEPVVWPSSVALFHVARLARTRVKVVLTGEGGDEMFAGYLKYRVAIWNRLGAPLYRELVPQPLQQMMRNLLGSAWAPDWLGRKLRHSFLYHPDAFQKIYFDNFYCAFPQDRQSELLTAELQEELRGADAYASAMRSFPSNGNGASFLNRLLYLDVKTYLVELLMKQDQMSMAASIESRVPFLDHTLVEFAARLPAHLKVRLLSGKYLLRKAMAGRLPPAVLRRTKKGFPTPVRPWLRHTLFDQLSRVLTNGRMAERRLVRPGFVLDLLQRLRQGDSWATEGCWRLLNFELWCRIFLDHDHEGLTHAAFQREGVTACV